MKLMIVDDNREVRIFLRNLFEHCADEIIECSDGLNAVKMYTEHLPDYVLMDVEMEGLDGFAATSRITKKHQEAKVIIVTGYANEIFNKIAMESGAMAFVSKDNLLELEKFII